MLDHQNDVIVNIPAKLNDVVNNSLEQVNRIHRRKVSKRVGATFGSLVIVAAAISVFGLINPALASQIPIIGRLFKQINTDSKTYGAANLEGYGAVQQIGKLAKTESADCALTVTQAFSDGNDIQIAFELELPEESTKEYSWIDAQMGKSCTVSVDGENVPPPYDMAMNSFQKLEGRWFTTMHLSVPQALRGKESYQVSLVIQGLSGCVRGDLDQEPLNLQFSVDFTVLTDTENSFSFESSAEDNGAKVLAVTGTPSRTVISIVKPYWGEANPNPLPDGVNITDPDVFPSGFPHLYTENGEEIRINHNEGDRMEHPYDPYARETQTADLVFDGAPAGTKRLFLRFIRGDGSDEIMAEFTIDLEKKTVTPGGEGSGTRSASPQKAEGGPELPYDLTEIQGYLVSYVSFTEEKTGIWLFTPSVKGGENLRVEITGADNTLLAVTDSISADGVWNREEWWDFRSEEEKGSFVDENGNSSFAPVGCPSEYSILLKRQGPLPASGDTVTVTVTDLDTGSSVLTQEIVLR